MNDIIQSLFSYVKEEVNLKIINNSSRDICDIAVRSIDNFDYPSANRPDYNFSKARIPSGGSKQEKVDLNSVASNCPFTMELTFSDGTADTFRVFMKYAANKGPAYFQHLDGNRNLSYGRSGNTLEVTVKD